MGCYFHFKHTANRLLEDRSRLDTSQAISLALFALGASRFLVTGKRLTR